MKRLTYVLTALAVFCAQAAYAQSSLPKDRYVYSSGVDYYGSDLTPLFDTTQDACRRSCSASSACVAFTYNSRSSACFPKSAVSDQTPYAGAISAQKVTTSDRVIAVAAERLNAAPFITERDIADARRLARGIGARFPLNERDYDRVLADALSAWTPANAKSARTQVGTALAVIDRADLWTRFGRQTLALKNTSKADAIPAIVNGYLRAQTPQDQSWALRQLARAYEDRRRGKDMVRALRLASEIQPSQRVSEALDKAIAKYGFRVVGTRVDNNSAVPRICAEFSENLASGQDYEDFVRVNAPGTIVSAEGQTLCVEGVEFGARYAVTFRSGLPSETNETLIRDVGVNLYVRDRPAAVRFPGRAFVLPRSADAALPVQTVNLNALELRLRRVSERNVLRAIQDSYFGKPLSGWEDKNFVNDIAQEIWTGTGDVQNTLNTEMTTRLPMGDVIGDLAPGIYALSARIPGADPYENAGATQWFVLSDLGISTWKGNDGLTVGLRGLSDAGARAGAEVTLISRANAVLGTATTDTDGFVQFAAGLTRGTGASAPALVVARLGDDDIAFLPLTDPAFDLSDRGVEGRPPAPPIDTFLTTDRGAYRPGDVIHATVLTRDAQAQAILDLPLTAILSRPDGVEYSRHTSTGGVAGGHVFALPVANTVARGTWRLQLMSDLDAAPLATQTILVEDFLPERIDVDLSLPEAPLRLGDRPPLTVNAQYLFGAPGADLVVEGSVRLRSRDTLDGWNGYVFGRHDAKLTTRTAYLNGGRTDANGIAQMELTLPSVDGDHPILEATAIIAVTEGSGRPVERRISKAITPDQPVIGIKAGFEDILSENSDALFELIAVGADGQATNMDVTWTVNRVQTRYQWYRLFGNWNWEPITRRTRIATGDAALGATPTAISAPTQWGEYELVVESASGQFTASSFGFSAGWYGGGDASATPDRLDVSLDATSYSAGDTARLRIVPRYAGTALISVLSGHVIERQVVEVSEGENVIPLSVSDAWGTGAYVSATVIRPMDVSAGQNPARSLGLAHASIDPADKALSVSIEAPDTVSGQSGRTNISVKVEGVKAGETAYVTLAAVDLGILNLTGFDAPDPQDHYFGQRRLGVEMRDVYGRLIDGLNGAVGQVRSGGDAASSMRLQSPPPTEKLMAFFSGPVTVGPDGAASIAIDRPDFNGAIRLMAVAWSKGGVGQASRDILARDPVVLTASLPRFLAPGDNSRLLLELVHADGPAGDVGLQVQASGVMLETAPVSVTLTEKGSAKIDLGLTADAIGDHPITVTLTLPNGATLTKNLTLGVRSNDPVTATTRRFSLGAGETFTYDANVFAGLLSGTGNATLTAGPLARFDVPGLLRQLDRYPYGCTEQVTSAAMPLLSVGAFANQAGIDDVQARINDAIARVLTRQASNGAFGLWRAQSGEFWLDAYVTDFLSRAKTGGYDVPKLGFSIALDNLRNRVNYAPDFDKGGEDVAYALLVLAREGAASMGDLRYYADTKAGAFSTPLGAAQLGAALAQYGDQTRADRMFNRAAGLLLKKPAKNVWRSDFGSQLRDTAGVLRLVAEAGSTAIDQNALSAFVTRAGRQLSTQEAAQVVMAAQALRQSVGASGVEINGQTQQGPFTQTLADTDRASHTIRNTSTSAMDVTLTTYGVPDAPQEPTGYGYSIKRDYFTLDGDYAEGDFKAGERRVVVLSIEPFENVGARLIVDDALPAGLEIDNPNLLRSGDIKGLDWLKPKFALHAEFRADRFLAAVDHRGNDAFQLAYIVRAVSPGDYHHPAALVEDMYRPEYRALTASGTLSVRP
ncbi:MG2 domain-containing protein [Pseudosulfitobacter sp. SM2401]|uniref:alpha-2-macroglobulin family protein n=1 Tax=Pseudosulfitobacter sp. SM2401 TaxID=3350098 RepID=UPI0036F393FC